MAVSPLTSSGSVIYSSASTAHSQSNSIHHCQAFQFFDTRFRIININFHGRPCLINITRHLFSMTHFFTQAVNNLCSATDFLLQFFILLFHFSFNSNRVELTESDCSLKLSHCEFESFISARSFSL